VTRQSLDHSDHRALRGNVLCAVFSWFACGVLLGVALRDSETGQRLAAIKLVTISLLALSGAWALRQAFRHSAALAGDADGAGARAI
jgi:hypothetical protein